MWWKKPVQRPRRATEGRFEVLKTETTLVLRDLSTPSRWRQLYAAPLIAFVVFPVVLLVARTETVSLWPWITFAALGVAASVLDLVWIFRGTTDEAPPYRRVQRSLIIEALPETSGLRDAPHRPAIILDGSVLDASSEPRVVMTRAGSVDRSARYRVSIIVGGTVVRVDTFRDSVLASWLAGELRVALGLERPAVESETENLADPWAALMMVAFLELGGIAVATCVCAMIDCADRVGTPLALAGIVASTAFVVGRRFGFRDAQSAATAAAQETYGVPPPEPARLRVGDRVFTVLVSSVIAAVMIGGSQLSNPDLPRPMDFCWSLGSTGICRADMDGDGIPEAIGETCHASSWRESVLDVRSGRLRTGLEMNEYGGASLAYCEAPFLTARRVVEDDMSYVTAWETLHKSTNPLWQVTVKGSVQEIERADGCALVRTYANAGTDEWGAFSLSTGEPCKTLAKADILGAGVAARNAREHPRAARGPQTVDGVTYALAEIPGSPPELTLSAARGEAVLWTTALPGRPVKGLPMAVAEGVVVVAAMHLRTGYNLRLIGVDAATGRIRYVHLHPGMANLDMVAAGPMVLVWSGRLAGVVPSSGQVVWITK